MSNVHANAHEIRDVQCNRSRLWIDKLLSVVILSRTEYAMFCQILTAEMAADMTLSTIPMTSQQQSSFDTPCSGVSAAIAAAASSVKEASVGAREGRNGAAITLTSLWALFSSSTDYL